MAIPHKIGEYTIDIEVFNRAMNIIPKQKVSTYFIDSKRIAIKVKATGYKTLKYVLNINENQTLYKRDFILEDLERNFFVVDLNDSIIESAYIRQDQYGFEADEYGLTVFIPKADWPVPSSEKVELFDSFWGFPMKKSAEITPTDEFYQIKLRMTRKDLKWSGEDIFVVINNKKPSNLRSSEKYLKSLAKLESDKENGWMYVDQMAKFIAGNFNPDELNLEKAALPQSLNAIYSLKERFAEVHKF